MRALVILSLFGVLFLTSCGGNARVLVTDVQGRTVGSIRLEGKDNATILSVNDEERGRVRGNLVRDDDGARVGTVELRNDSTVLMDEDGNEIGSVEKGTECYGMSQKLLGTVSTDVDPEAVGAACMLLLLSKER